MKKQLFLLLMSIAMLYSCGNSSESSDVLISGTVDQLIDQHSYQSEFKFTEQTIAQIKLKSCAAAGDYYDCQTVALNAIKPAILPFSFESKGSTTATFSEKNRVCLLTIQV